MSTPSLVRPLRIGTLSLPTNILFAPLAGCSDFPYRQMCRRYHQGLIYCEMVKIEALIRSQATTCRMLHYSPDMHPIGAQLCGSNPQLAGAAAKIIEDMGFDILDLNCGCPVDKVTQDGSGSGLLRTPTRIGEIIANMCAAVRIPVSVKVRVGWDDNHIIVEDLVRMAELAGAKAITVHGRTRKQGYSGAANLEWIRAAKQQAREIKVIGNGDLFSAAAARRMLEETQCDGVLLARGGIGQPWLADDIWHDVQGHGIPVRTADERRRVLIDHYNAALSYGGDSQAIVDMRRIGCSYIGRLAGGRKFREAFNKAASLQEIEALIDAVPLEG